MRGHTRTRALTVVVVTSVAALVVAGLSTGAFGVQGGQRFVSTPNVGRAHHLPAAINNRSVTQCPEGGSSVLVRLLGTATTLQASTTADVNGRWAVAISIPPNLPVGVYSVTAACTGATTSLTYRPQQFRVIPPPCGPAPTTSTTAKCRPPAPPSGANGPPGAPGPNA